MLRVIASFLLALCLSLTSVTAAVSHARAAGAVQIELCGTPGKVERITLDATGQPLPDLHHCPDCLLLTAGEAPLPAALQRPATRSERAALPRLPVPGRAAAPAPSARGPPVLI